MKRIIIIAIMLTSTGAVIAQTPAAQTQSQPAKKKLTAPAAVQKAFEQKFPKATKVNWGKENATEWEAEFMLDGNELSANFSADGKWVETERKIKVSELPKAVAAAIQKQYPGWKISDAAKTESAKDGIFYEAQVKSGN